MTIPTKSILVSLGAVAALSALGCGQPANKPRTLDEERAAVRGSTPPADAGAKYMASQGSDPAAIQAKVNSAGAAFQNRKQR